MKDGIPAPGAEKKPAKRGRPVKYPTTRAFFDAVNREALLGKKDVGRTSRYVRARGHGVALAIANRLTWCFDQKLSAAGAGRAAWKPTVLVELGMMLDEGWPKKSVITIARKLCTEKPPVRRAVEFLRQTRRAAVGRQDREPEIEETDAALRRAVNDYLARFPAVRPDIVAQLLEGIARELASVPEVAACNFGGEAPCL